MPSWMSYSFQDSCSFSMMELSLFYDHVISVLVGIVVFILYVIIYMLMESNFYKNLSEGTMIEVIWSVIPAFILIVLVLPSMKVLYLMEDIKSPSLTFKIVAHQWYWSYVVPFYKNYFYSLMGNNYFYYEYDSMMEEDNYPRLLNCSKSLFIPMSVSSRFLLFSTDVLHSFAVPSMGLKVDAIPGRINQLFVNPSRLGVFYGQCSEICGSNHSFMPISLKVVDLSLFDYISKCYLLESLEEDYNLKGLDLLGFSLNENVALS